MNYMYHSFWIYDSAYNKFYFNDLTFVDDTDGKSIRMIGLFNIHLKFLFVLPRIIIFFFLLYDHDQYLTLRGSLFFYSYKCVLPHLLGLYIRKIEK